MGRVGSVSQRAEGAALARAARPVPDRGNARYVRPRCAHARAINNLSYGRSDLQNAPTGQGTISYGGRFGSARQFGVFVGGSSYVNVFPSAQLRLALDERTNVRVAVTTGIARPLYYDLAPHTSVTPGALATDLNAVSLGNTDLRPTRSVNYEALIEHFSVDVGVAQIGVFYKTLSDFIYNRSFTYVGAPLDGYNATQPTNGRNGYIYAMVRKGRSFGGWPSCRVY